MRFWCAQHPVWKTHVANPTANLQFGMVVLDYSISSIFGQSVLWSATLNIMDNLSNKMQQVPTTRCFRIISDLALGLGFALRFAAENSSTTKTGSSAFTCETCWDTHSYFMICVCCWLCCLPTRPCLLMTTVLFLFMVYSVLGLPTHMF